MTNRKKRLQKGIESLEGQIRFHIEKKEAAEQLGKQDLVEYYEGEIATLRVRKRNREDMLEKA